MKLLSKESLSLLALKAFSLILLLFLLTAPVFCLVIERDMRAGATGIPFGYLAARGVRLALTVGLCLWLRHRSRAVLANSGNRQVLGFALVLGCAVLSLALNGVAAAVYMGLSHSVGFPQDMHLFWAVLYEQMLGGNFLWSVLLGQGVLFFPLPKRRASKAA